MGSNDTHEAAETVRPHPSSPPYWERRENHAGDHPDGERLHRYRFHSRVLPDPGLRDALVYLPPQYIQQPQRRFPVFYLQDAQNLIDPSTAFIPGQIWHAHTTADALATAGETEPVILVGIDHGGLRRMAEYTPGPDARLGGGEGRSYGRMIIDDLMPLVNQAYRTCTGAANTALGGSSLGALISLFLALEHPAVFGKVAALSPSVWWDHRSILARVQRGAPHPRPRIWLDIGSAEGRIPVRDAEMLYHQLLRQGWRAGDDISYLMVEGGEHNEHAWAQRFDRVLRFLFPPIEIR
jgi:predicted alpha/beta superfamily hydrolase